MVRVLVLGLGLIGPAIAVAALVWAYMNLEFDLGLGAEEWRTYTNEEFEYAVSYPPDWTIETRDPSPDDDFETQWVRLSSGADHVMVVVNFQGDWCTDSVIQPPREEPVVLGGFEGTDFRCHDDGDEVPEMVVRYFPGAKGRMNYWAGATIEEEAEEAIEIIESFRFLD